ncbi:CU044_5270 family protein [Catellatospora sp. NPDC049111]|uniref:CU044_5270 family protein n=1 Tax=Catellatospora sp. NPDC049111 TaxID=3155271 RepID=UPI00340A61FF
MNIDELVRSTRPRASTGWAGSDGGQQVLDGIVAASPADRAVGAAAGRTRRPALRIAMAAALPAAALTAAAAVFLAGGTGTAPPRAEGTPSPQVPGTAAPASAVPVPQTAQQFFLVAAERTEAASTATSGRYWVLSKEHAEPMRVGPAARPYHVLYRMEIAYWDNLSTAYEGAVLRRNAGAAPITAEDIAAWTADGSPTQWVVAGGKLVITAEPGPWTAMGGRPAPRESREQANRLPTYDLAGGQVTLAQLNALPTEPRALRRKLSDMLHRSEVLIANDHTLFVAVQQLVSDLPVTPQVRAAAYRVLAEVKGATLLGTVQDQNGRTGTAVGFVRKDDGGRWYQTRLIVDLTTGKALAEETWDLGSGRKPATTGTLRSSDLVVRAEFTDENPPAAS